MSLDEFNIDWDPEVPEDFFEDFPLRDAIPYSPIKHYFNWYQPTDDPRQFKPIGERFKYMFSSSLGLSDEHEWRFERPMGKGSFGAAALFTRQNERQERTDAFVLKVTDVNPLHGMPSKAQKQSLTQEAAIMAQANDLHSDALVRLRQFKVDVLYCRYYTEFCEYGNLETLRMKYKAWNRHFPELFLWHVFHYLANAYLEFTRGPWRSLKGSEFGEAIPGQYLLHNDIKTDNVFLAANKEKVDDTVWYPMPKVGDFGLAITTNPDDILRNHAKVLQRGTKCWQPPEQRLSSMHDYKYHFREDVHPDMKNIDIGVSKKFHRIRPEANIWAIGAVMWNLVTMEEIETLSGKVHNILYGQTAASRAFDGTNVLKRADPEIRKRYSAKLWDLICDCTKMCTQQAIAEYARTRDLTPFAVAFQENQINDLPDGGADFPKYRHFWNDFGDELLWNPPEWGHLCPPEAPRDINFWVEGMPSPLCRRQILRWEEAIEERDRKNALAALAERDAKRPKSSARRQTKAGATRKKAGRESSGKHDRDDDDQESTSNQLKKVRFSKS